MLRQIVDFLGGKWPRKDRRKRVKMMHYVPLSVYDDGITYGYARRDESINDLI